MWYKRRQAEQVYARKLGRREVVEWRIEGHGSAGDSVKRYSSGDYLVYEGGKGIYFMKGKDFEKEFDTTNHYTTAD